MLVAVFDRGEKAAGEWVGSGMDVDLERLEALISQQFKETNFGIYLQELKSRFEGPIVADMVCLLRLQLEMSVQARAHLMARQAGLDLPVDEDFEATLERDEVPARSIGAIGLLALKPLQVSTGGTDSIATCSHRPGGGGTSLQPYAFGRAQHADDEVGRDAAPTDAR